MTPFANTFDIRFPFDIGLRHLAKKIVLNLEPRLSLFSSLVPGLEVGLSLYCVSAVLPIARDSDSMQNTVAFFKVGRPCPTKMYQ